ncbi:MAG: hypothetical protein ACOX20_00025 [Limnochordia bacterium]
MNIRRADPEVLIVWTHGDEHALICRQVAQLLPDVQYYGSMAITQWSSIQMAEGTSEGAYTTSPYSYLNPDPRCPGLRQEARGALRPPAGDLHRPLL